MGNTEPRWIDDWNQAVARHTAWWRQEGMVLFITAPKDEPWEPVAEPEPARNLKARWVDPDFRAKRAAYQLSRTYFGADALPVAPNNVGAGDLAAMLGAGWHFAETTVWYESSIDDPDRHPPLEVDFESEAYQRLEAIIRRNLEVSAGRFLVGMPDLVENIDILAALRDPQNLMMDMLERPDWVERKVAQINRAYFQVFDRYYDMIRDDLGGNVFSAFQIWGPGRTAKVQCDAAAMFGPEMFQRFVVPALAEQCRRLDYSMFHLDGEDCIRHLDLLLDIPELDAIEWTPVHTSLGLGGGEPAWYDLYRRILDGGKSVQAISVHPEQVIPLIDAVGAEGMYIQVQAESEEQARRIAAEAERYR
jgi:hypothetical protein